jgi:hypothetical protein
MEYEEGNLKCWRCGMLLPSHELKMMEGQLYCAYCFQDVTMERAETEATRRSHAGEGTGAGGEGGYGPRSVGRMCEVCGRSVEHGHYAFSGKFVCAECYPKESHAAHGGYCSRCGRETTEIYMLAGRQFCPDCFTEESGHGGGKDWGTAIKENVERLFGIRKKVPAKLPKGEMDRRFREEVLKREKERKEKEKKK